MAAKVGIVQSINDGKFFAKDSSGNTKELKVGDIIYENDVVFSDGSNSSLAQITVALEGEDIIVLKNGVQQLFDSSLIASTFGDEEMVFAKESIDAMLDSHSDITNVWSNLNEEGFSDYQDITEEETAAGEEEEEVIEEGSIGQFASRDGDITDIVSDLRKKSWIRTQNYKEVENSEALEKTSLKPLGGLDSTTNTPPPTVTPPPLTPPTVTPPTVTPPPPVANLSIDDITMYEQDGYMVFTVTLDRPANGNITVNFATSNGTAESGKDYTPTTGVITIPSGSSTAQIRVPIKDDYYYEKSETFNVTLTNPTGNVNIVKPVGVGTILDNPPTTGETPTTNNTPDSGTGTYDSGDTVYVKLVNSATTIEDMTKQTGPLVIDGVKNDGILEHFLQLVDKNGNYVEIPDDKSITVTLEYSSLQGTIDDSDFDNTRTIEITLTKDNLVVNHDGTLSYKITNHAIIDSIKEKLESYNLKITDIKQNGDAFENVIIHKDLNTVTGTIIDVTPLVEAIVTPEDTVKDIELTDQTKDISKMLVDNGKGFVELTKGGKVDLYDNGKVVGAITYDENDKKFTFTPNEDYSNYKNTDDIKFMYFAEFANKSNEFKQVKVQVTPVADAPTITVNDVIAYEDASIYNQKDKGNLAEGGNKIPLELKVPLLSKDQTDKNGANGDHPERNGEITLKFTNGLAVTGAEIFNGSTEVATINSAGQELKVVIVKTSGGTDIDTSYHHSGTLPAKGGNVLYLTKTEYENLKIQHTEDNDTDIKINIGITSYELGDDEKPLFGNDYYSDKSNINLKSEKTADMTVKILPVTDDISIKWDNTSKGAYTEDGKTYTFTSVDKQKDTLLNIKEILSATSGALNGTGGTKGDLDGSEHRTYEITGLPKGTKVKLDNKTFEVKESGTTGYTVTKDADGNYTISIPFPDNTKEDPDFSIKLPEYYAGTVNGTITLKVQDKGVEESSNSSKWGEIKTDSVNFKINVNPVVINDLSNNTIQIAQAIGNEDAGRDKINSSGEIVSSNGNITNPKNGLKLNIEPKGSNLGAKGETATIWIDKVPVGGSLYIYDNNTKADKLIGVEDGKVYEYTKDSNNEYTVKTELLDGKSGNISVSLNGDGTYKVEILDYQNSKLPTFIPPHNDDSDYTFKISGEKVSSAVIDGQTIISTEKYDRIPLDMSVIVKNIADEPINTELVDSDDKVVTIGGEKYIKAIEDEVFYLKDIYKNTPSSYDNDGSEVLSIKITLPGGVTMVDGKKYHVDGNDYVIKSTDLENIKLQFPKNFSGNTGDIKLKYITTEQSGENSSKTHFEQTVKLFVSPVVDGKLQDKSTATEELVGDKYIKGTDSHANKSFYKLDLGVIDNKGDTDEYIDSVQFTVPTSGYELYILNGSTFTKVDSTNNIIVKEDLGKIYVQVNEHFSGDVKVGIAEYTIKDKTNNLSTNEEPKTEQDYIHTLTIKPVTDKPYIVVNETTATTSEKVTIDDSDNTKITISQNSAEFTVKVKTTSADTDESETVQRIEITGVPKGVEVIGAKFEGYKGGSGVWVITPADNKLDSDGAFSDIKFIVHNGDDFDNRTVTIKTFTKDGIASEENNFVNITLRDTRPIGDKGGNGTDVLPNFTLTTKDTTISEDMGREDESTKLTVGDLFNVENYTNTNITDNYNWAVTFTDIPAGSEVKGLDGRSVYSYEDGGKTYYVVSGGPNGTNSDIQNELNKVQIILPKDKNSGQPTDGDLYAKFNITGTISTTKGGSSYQSPEAKIEDRDIKPVTDKMTITITANNIDEDGTSNIKINLSNPSDGSKTEIGDTLTITVVENWKDIADGGGANGTLTVPAVYTIIGTSIDANGNTVYSIKKSNGSNFSVGDIDGLTYKSASNRDGDVKFEVSVQNKEGDSIELTSKGETTIKVTPVIDTVLNASTIVETGTEDFALVGLANPLKVTITASGGADALVITDKSETLGNIVLDKIPNGMTVWYMDGENLKMATNIGTSTGDYTLNPNGDKVNVGVNKWLIPTVGSNVIPEIYVNAPENWAGTFDFDVKLSVYEQNLATPVEKTIKTTGKIEAVADGLTASGTKITKNVFQWADLQLNANMKDVDGSEVMNLELTGLSANATFKIKGSDTLVSATHDGSKWTISGIKVDDINKIQFMDTKATTEVKAEIWTEELDKDGKSFATKIESEPKVLDGNLAEIKAITETFTFDKELSLDFNNIDSLSDGSIMKNVTTLDLGSSNAAKNELLNLTLQDVLDMGKKDGNGNINLEILGGGMDPNQDKVSFKNLNEWKSVITEEIIDSKTFKVYTSNDESVKVKVQTEIDTLI